MSKAESLNWFEFTTQEESAKFAVFLGYINPLVQIHFVNIKQTLEADPKESFLSAEKAFMKVFAIIIRQAKSADLIAFYSNFSIKQDYDQNIAEIIVDTIYDEARYRSSSPSASAEDHALYVFFTSYHTYAQTLSNSLDGIINALMSLFEFSGLSMDEKRMQLIKETIPVISANATSLAALWNGECSDSNLISFISRLKLDLEQIARTNTSRFRNFFTLQEFTKISKMPSEQLQAYLATAAAENNNLKEAKNLMKITHDIEFIIKEIGIVEKALNITQEKLDAAQADILNFSKIETGLLK